MSLWVQIGSKFALRPSGRYCKCLTLFGWVAEWFKAPVLKFRKTGPAPSLPILFSPKRSAKTG